MSDLARLTVDLAGGVGAERVVSLGARAPQRLAEISTRMPLLVLDDEARLAELRELAPAAEARKWEPGSPLPAAATEAAATALIVCDGLLAELDDPAPALATLDQLLDTAPAALLSTADRDLLSSDDEQPAAPWNTAELLDLLGHSGLETVWIGLSDAAGSLGRRAGLTAALSRREPAAVRAALAAGPLGLAWDPAAVPMPTGRRARVCIACYEFVGPTRTGGIGTAYTSLAEALADAEHEVTVLFTGWADPSAEPFGHWVRDYKSRGIELLRLPQPTASWIETGHRHAVRSYEAYRWLRERDRADPFDVIHFPEVLGHGYYSICARRLGIAFERTTIAIGTHSSTSWVLEANGTLFQALDDIADDFIERRCVEGCDALISPSAYMRDWMRARGWRLPERNFVQQYARSGAVAGPERPPVADGPQPPPAAAGHEATELVFFGRLEPRKGIRVFCDALDLLAAQCPGAECRLTFLGKQASIDGVEAAEFVRRRAQRWPWKVELIDELGQPEAIAYLRSPGRRMTVIPSLADNSPNTVYEALALGIPFIASRVGGTAELIDPRDLARTSFDPEADRPRSGSRGAAALAKRLRAALSIESFEPPRPATSAEACREAHVRWHANVVAVPPGRRAEASAPAGVSVCVLGSDAERAAASRRSLESQSQAPAEVIVAAEAAAAAPGHDLILFMPAGARLADGAIEALEHAARVSGAEVIAISIAIAGAEHGAGLARVPVGGPRIAGLLRRCFGDAGFLIRRATLARLGGIDPTVDPGDQTHQLLCRAAIAGVEIEVFPDPLLLDAPADAIGAMSVVEQSSRRQGILQAYRDAPIEVLAELPLLAQQLFSVATEREREFVSIYENRFGRFTLPIRRWAVRGRRLRRVLRPRS